MNNLFGIVSDLPIFYLVPLFVFGPVFLLVLYNFGLKGIFWPSPEVRERQQQIKVEKESVAKKRSKKISANGMKKKSASRTPMQWLGQGVSYAAFALFVSYFSNAPAYTAHPQEKAMIKLSFAHPGKHTKPCHKRTREELKKLPINMRAPMKCSRERWPVTVNLTVDGITVFHGVAEPAGLSKDGHSSFYQTFAVSNGHHRVEIGIGDSGQNGGKYDYFLEHDTTLLPTEILAIGFDNASEKITMQ